MMTLEQLSVFVAVADGEHLTKGAAAVGLTPSAASSAIKALESFYKIRLFDRVGRRIELTREGRVMLVEARRLLAQARATESVLSELAGLKTGILDVEGSQTVANYWLPPRLLRFARRFPGITVNFKVGNTSEVAQAVISGSAELGFIEGTIDEPALATVPMGTDRLMVVTGSATATKLSEVDWIMREQGSGTRAVFEAAIASIGIDPASLPVALVLPTNESILAAVLTSDCAAALSETVVAPFVRSGELRVIEADLPPREFTLLRHRERRPSAAAREFESACRT